MTALSATSARANLYRLIDQVNDESEPLTITGQRGNAVLVGEDDWRAIQETLHLESVPGFTDSVRAARDEGIGAGSDKLDWRVVYARQAQKEAKKIASSGLKPRLLC
ncbi:type II toxin-antitoxin system Phd/YefM family antitoxin [Flexivirga oryzae]|uniref:Antitoxin n=1 Tax=Flexivirga oryzae TaxID=1794944 RepID=A0A839N8F2_9MICO|nr:type II toxin-antitoxin system Phd/YefM family antitoxin [Flexivirga oryzae]MBB2891906.1 prevent-host-death family protein [Flexivirga oryzae]